MMPSHIEHILDGLEELKGAIIARSEPFDDVWTWPYRKLDCALRRLSDYATVNTFGTDDDLADVLADYVQWAVAELRDMTEELDDRYAEQP